MKTKKQSSHFGLTIAAVVAIILTAAFALITCEPPVKRKYPTPTPTPVVSPTRLPAHSGTPISIRPERKSK